MADECIKITHLNKTYGKQRVLDDVNVNFEEGKIHGLIGRNGSGKTVLLKCICGFIPYDSGTISVDGHVVGKDIEMPDRFGVIIEKPGFIGHYSGYRNLKFLAGLRSSISPGDILDALKAVGLEEEMSKKVSKYSLGMRQRLGIAQAIMERPRLMLLDEPLSGLDSGGVREIRKLFLDYRAKSNTIIIASHNAEDIRILCDTVHRIDNGKLTRDCSERESGAYS